MKGSSPSTNDLPCLQNTSNISQAEEESQHVLSTPKHFQLGDVNLIALGGQIKKGCRPVKIVDNRLPPISAKEDICPSLDATPSLAHTPVQ
ncbi:hypothetical protein UPYG_G00259940 [Umbra pygmaea]|uniref:Prolactin receptor n=1 Tax=Umbra pygmaea TaxID=75934 RepID=A0ABD0WDF8_UMBPY